MKNPITDKTLELWAQEYPWDSTRADIALHVSPMLAETLIKTRANVINTKNAIYSIQLAIAKRMVGSCTCDTKSPDVQHHDRECQYVQLNEVYDACTIAIKESLSELPPLKTPEPNHSQNEIATIKNIVADMHARMERIEFYLATQSNHPNS